MRDIKFRAWRKENNAMMTFCKNELCRDEFMRRFLCRMMCGDFGDVLMQFTGLTDDSEKEVEAYEGDLIKCQLGCVRVIEFIDGSFVGVDPDCDFDELMLSEYYFEIIGNKFQNPELLEQS